MQNIFVFFPKSHDLRYSSSKKNLVWKLLLKMELRKISILLLIVCALQFVSTIISDELRVTLSNGSKLVGRYLRSYSGRPIKAFTGIPYAKPPLGPLRFKVWTFSTQLHQSCRLNYKFCSTLFTLLLLTSLFVVVNRLQSR